VPRQRWQAISLRHYVDYVLDQNGYNSCVGAAGVAAVMAARRQLGLSPIELSIGSLYGQINGGVDRGCELHASVMALKTIGCCPVDVIQHCNWQQKYWPKGWKKIAKQYRIVEAYDCQTFDEIASALQCGYVVCYGIFIPSSFMDVKSDGIVPSRVRYKDIIGAHAMLAIGMKKIRRRWYLETQNSWGVKWGNNGFCYIPESYLDVPQVDAWALRVTTFCGNGEGKKDE